jgi:OmpA-OmpF porin, OOP family
MCKVLLLFAFFFFKIGYTTAQYNFVPNPGFEDHWNCPVGFDEIPAQGEPVISLKDWFKPTWGSSDYFHECMTELGSILYDLFGFILPKDKQAYSGIYLYSFGGYGDTSYTDREYLSIHLKEPLLAGKQYCLSFYASPVVRYNFYLPQYYFHASSCIGMYVSKDLETYLDPIDRLPRLLHGKPQIEAQAILTDVGKWYLINGTYEAQGGEQWLTIGNFQGDSVSLARSVPVSDSTSSFMYYTAYCLIDRVGIYQTDRLFQIEDTTVVCNEPEFLTLKAI